MLTPDQMESQYSLNYFVFTILLNAGSGWQKLYYYVTLPLSTRKDQKYRFISIHIHCFKTETILTGDVAFGPVNGVLHGNLYSLLSLISAAAGISNIYTYTFMFKL